MADEKPTPQTEAQKLAIAIGILAGALNRKEIWTGRPSPNDPNMRPKEMVSLYFNPQQPTGLQAFPTVQSLADAIQAKGKELRISAEFDLLDGNEQIKANMISVKPGYLVCVVRRFTSVGGIKAGVNNYGEATANRAVQQVAGVASVAEVQIGW